MLYLRNLIEIFAIAMTVLMLGRVLLSWVDQGGRSQASVFVRAATEPILGPVRWMLPQTGMIDLSPMIVLFALTFIVQALR